MSIRISKVCKRERCWICEKAGVRTLLDFHDWIIEQNKLRSRYFLAFTALGRFLIGQKADVIYNQCAQPDYNGHPEIAFREIISNFNLAKALRAQDKE